MTEIRLLGSIAIVRGGETVAVSSRRLRALLALLAVSTGRTVSVEALTRGIWDEHPAEHVRAGSRDLYADAGVVAGQMVGEANVASH